MNHMKQFFCPAASALFWANSCKMKRIDGKVRCEYRCCKCGEIHGRS